jgi:Do/DeqQ family serine protease
MNEPFRLVGLGRRTVTVSVAIIAGLLLLIGGNWRGVASELRASATHAAASVTTPIAHPIAGGRDSYADVVKVVAPAVVTIHTEGKASASPTQFQMPNDDFFRRFFGNPGDQNEQNEGPSRMPHAFKQHALGSGVIVGADGYILTNNHVVAGADDVRVEMTDGRTLAAKVVGTDKASDLALIKVDASGLNPIALANSDNVQVGDVVLAVGNPLGVGQTVTMGIISAKGRSTQAGSGTYEDFLQTDAPINQGNSGGALVNTKGELVGINSQIVSESGGNIGIGFAIPSNMAKHVMDDLRKDGRVRRAQLGVTVQAMTSDMAASLGLTQVGGAIVSSVTPGSAADHAGIKQGDVIESFNGQGIHDTNSLRNHVADAEPGSSASVTLLRNGSEKTLTVKLDEANVDKTAVADAEPGRDDKTGLGVTVEPLTPELAARVGAPKDAHGMVVEDVNPEGRAAAAGLQSGDVIEQVNRQPVQSVDDLRAAMKNAGNKPVLLLIGRQGHDLFMAVRPAKANS